MLKAATEREDNAAWEVLLGDVERMKEKFNEGKSPRLSKINTAETTTKTTTTTEDSNTRRQQQPKNRK